MRSTKLAFILSIFLITNFSIYAQDTNETGLNYALNKLSVLNKKPDWKKASYVDEYKRNLTKAKLYFDKFKKESSDAVNINTFQNRIRSFEMILRMNTQQNAGMTVPTPEFTRERSNESNENPMAAQIKAREEALKRQWEKSQEEAWKEEKDNGIGNDVHRENVGKIRFGIYKYGGSPRFIEEVKMETPFEYHLFLPNSIQNLAVKEAKETKDRRWLAVTDNKIQFVISANGKVMHQWLEVNPDSLEPNTYYSNMVMTNNPIDVYGRGDFYGFYVKEVLLKNRIGGNLDIKVEAFLYNARIGDTRKPKIAEGSFKVSYTGADWAKLDKERNIKREQREYRIPCKHALSFRTSPSGVKSEYNKQRGSTTLYSKGQKIYVYNPISTQTKYLMTLTSSTQAIVVPMSFCSY